MKCLIITYSQCFPSDIQDEIAFFHDIKAHDLRDNEGLLITASEDQ